MTTKTETVETRHGEVQYEIVECDSCGVEIREEDAVGFVVGEGEPVRRRGVACPSCLRDGPLSFPERARRYSLPRMDDNQGSTFFAPFLFGFFTIPVFTVAGLCPDAADFDEGYALAVITMLVWVVVPLLGVYLL